MTLLTTSTAQFNADKDGINRHQFHATNQYTHRLKSAYFQESWIGPGATIIHSHMKWDKTPARRMGSQID